METLAPRRRFDESKVKRAKGRFAKKAVGAFLRPPKVVRDTPEANVFRRHGDGDVTHVSEDGSQRMVYDASTGKFDQQMKQPDGSWSSIGQRSKLQTYLLTKLGWRVGDTEDQPSAQGDGDQPDAPDVSVAPDDQATTSTTHSSIATPNDDISTLTSDQVRAAYAAVNRSGDGEVLNDPYRPPSDLAQVAADVADAQSLTPLQVLRAVDASEAARFGDPNDNRRENAVVQYLDGADFPAPGGPLTTDAPVTRPATSTTLLHADTAPFPITEDFPTRRDTDMLRIQRDMESQGGARTTDETDAIHEYSVDSYTAMNDCLRTGNNCDPETIDRNDRLERAMRPTTEPVTVFRRMMLDNLPGVTSAADLQTLVGSDITDAGFTSTSLDPAQTEIFGNVRLQIAVPTGARATVPGSYSVHTGEQEVILAPGTRYRVIGVDASGTIPAVQLEVVP